MGPLRRLTPILGAVVSLALARPVGAAACELPPSLRGIPVPARSLSASDACLVDSVIRDPATASTAGPAHTPLERPLFDFLIDHPEAGAELARALAVENIVFRREGPDRFWADDKDGSAGTLRLLSKSETERLYYFDCVHDEPFYWPVRVRVVLLMKNESLPPSAGGGQNSTLAVYTRIEDPVIRTLISLFGRAARRVVSRKAVKGMKLSSRLGAALRRRPLDALRALPAMPLGPAERKELEAHLTRLLP
ncbi:MAG: hypothetical protein AAB578_02525 [Elusimicrobiota bacterium]